MAPSLESFKNRLDDRLMNRLIRVFTITTLLRDTGRLIFGKNTNLCNGKVECLNQFVGILYQLMFFIEMDK